MHGDYQVKRLIDAIRSILFNLTFYPFILLFCGLILAPLGFFVSEAVVRKGVDIFCRSSLWIARVVMGIRHEYRGLDKLPKEGGLILAAAHQSNMDPIMTFPLRNDVTALAKKQLFALPFIGTVLRKMKIVRIDRESRKAHKGMDVVAKHVVDLGRPLIVYPQATRVPPGKTKRLKSGAFHLQEATNLPVYTVSTNTGLFWTKGFWHRSGTAVFEIDGPYAPGRDKDEFMTLMQDKIVDRSHQLMADAGYASLLPKPEASGPLDKAS